MPGMNGMGGDSRFNNFNQPPMNGATNMLPLQLQPIFGVPLGHLDAWVLTPENPDEEQKNRWQRACRIQITKSQTELVTISREDASKGLTVTSYQSGGGVSGMRRHHVDQLLFARNASEQDPNASWEMASIKLFYKDHGNPISTLFVRPKLEVTKIRIVMRKALRSAAPRPLNEPNASFGQHMPGNQGMHNPMMGHPNMPRPQGQFPGPGQSNQFPNLGPMNDRPMQPPFNGGGPGGMPRGNNPGIVPLNNMPPGMVRVPPGGGPPPGVVPLGGGGGGGFGGGIRRQQSFDDDSDDDYDEPRRGSSHEVRRPKIVIPGGSSGGRGRRHSSAVSSDSDYSDDSDGNNSIRMSPISSYSSGSRFSGGKHGKFRGHKKSDSHHHSGRGGPDYREHGRRSPRLSGRRDSFASNDDYVVVHKKGSKHQSTSKRGSHGYHRRANSIDSLNGSFRSSSPRLLDNLAYRDSLEAENSRLRREKELRRLEDLELDAQYRREQEKEVEHQVNMARRRGRLEGLQERELTDRYADRHRYEDRYDDRPLLRRTLTERQRPGFMGPRRFTSYDD